MADTIRPPVLRASHVLVIALGAAAFIALVNATQLYFNWRMQGSTVSFARLLGGELVEWTLWAIAVPAIWLITTRAGEHPHPWRYAAMHHGALFAAFFVLQNAVLAAVTMIIEPGASGSFVTAYLVRAGFKLPGALVTYAFVLAICMLVLVAEEYHTVRVARAEMHAELTDARLRYLKMQIHPHFLFNTLHMATGLIRENRRDDAIHVISELSSLLRRALRDAEVQLVALHDELTFLDQYIAIQQMRFRDRLRVHLEIDDDAQHALVPSLLLQPLVENAIQHGLQLSRSTGTVRVAATRHGAELELSVTDDGVGMAADTQEGVGLGTTRTRLEQMYGDAFSLDVESPQGSGTRVRIVIPFVPQPSESELQPAGAASA